MKKLILLTTISLLIIGCSENQSEKNFFNGQFRSISFDKEYISKGKQLAVDSIGTVKVEIFEPYLILKNQDATGIRHFTKFYSSEENQYIGDFFGIGRGPKEFRSFNIIKKEYPYLWIYDFHEKYVLKLNIEHGMDDESFVIEQKYNYQSFARPLNVFFISDTCLVIKHYNFEKEELEYVEYNPETDIQIKTHKVITNPISDNFTRKILSSADNIHPDGSKIVIVTGLFNQIDILDIKNPSNNFSVSTADKPISFDFIDRTPEDNLREYYYSLPYCGDKFIGVLYDVSGDESNCEVHIIDWDGAPLGIVKFANDVYFITYTIDPVRKILYGVTKDGLVYYYDLQECDFFADLY